MGMAVGSAAQAGQAQALLSGGGGHLLCKPGSSCVLRPGLLPLSAPLDRAEVTTWHYPLHSGLFTNFVFIRTRILLEISLDSMANSVSLTCTVC